jgi:hypothetical protein
MINIDDFIRNRGLLTTTGSRITLVDQLTFAMIHHFDKDHVHIPEWYKRLRISKIIDYFINERIIGRKQMRYQFEFGQGWNPQPFDADFNNGHLHLTNFYIYGLTLADLMIVSNILQIPDIEEELSIKVSEPYDGKIKDIKHYKIQCKL